MQSRLHFLSLSSDVAWIERENASRAQNNCPSPCVALVNSETCNTLRHRRGSIQNAILHDTCCTMFCCIHHTNACHSIHVLMFVYLFVLLFFSLKVVSSVSSRLHLNRLSRPDLSSTDVRPNWRRRVASATSSCSRPVDWAALGERFRRGLSRLKGGVPALKMPPVRGRRGWCGCFQVKTHTQI